MLQKSHNRRQPWAFRENARAPLTVPFQRLPAAVAFLLRVARAGKDWNR